ncbi:MAG: phosphate signaling complex protein PhoU [Armatimonadetes bacterium]|nr:phosphate signaling complex protein PhoU [Armatimonadota bacterium]
MHSARKHFDDLLGELKERVMEMGVRAEKMVSDAVTALIRKDEALAREIIEADSVLDEMELEIQSTSMVLIAREAPVGRDVRFIGSAMSISTELERVGDDAVSIGKKGISLPTDFPPEYAPDLTELSEKARAMLLDALRAFSRNDTYLLDQIIAADAGVDLIWKRVRRRLKQDMRDDPEFVDAGFKLIQAFHHLEYVGDHAVSIAERLEFVRTGNLVRFNRATF